MTLRRTAVWLRWVFIVGVFATAGVMLYNGTLVSNLLAVKDWAEARDERLYGNWHWYDKLFELVALSVMLAAAAVGGWFVGRLWVVREVSDLPLLLKRFMKESDIEEFEKSDFKGFGRMTAYLSRKDILMAVPPIVGVIYLMIFGLPR